MMLKAWHFLFQFIPKVFGGIEVRALCITSQDLTHQSHPTMFLWNLLCAEIEKGIPQAVPSKLEPYIVQNILVW